VTNARDPDLFRPARDADERAKARRRLGLPEGGRGVGFIGTLLPHKGPLVFLDALERVLNAHADTWGVLAGGGPLRDEVERRTLANDRLVFLGGLAYPDEVADFYRALDVLAVPSYAYGQWSEQCSRALVEGMLSCPVVVSQSGAMPDVVKGVGQIVRERDADDLAAGIARSLESGSAQIEAARQRAIDRFSGEAIASQLEDIWEAAVNRRPERSRGS
jgi:glycosyltransferase involved in cell wall biosynthesis